MNYYGMSQWNGPLPNLVYSSLSLFFACLICVLCTVRSTPLFCVYRMCTVHNARIGYLPLDDVYIHVPHGIRDNYNSPSKKARRENRGSWKRSLGVPTMKERTSEEDESDEKPSLKTSGGKGCPNCQQSTRICPAYHPCVLNEGRHSLEPFPPVKYRCPRYLTISSLSLSPLLSLPPSLLQSNSHRELRAHTHTDVNVVATGAPNVLILPPLL